MEDTVGGCPGHTCRGASPTQATRKVLSAQHIVHWTVSNATVSGGPAAPGRQCVPPAHARSRCRATSKPPAAVASPPGSRRICATLAATLMPSLMAKSPTACPLPTACAAACRRRPLLPALPLLGLAGDARSSRPGNCPAAPTAPEMAPTPPGAGFSFTSRRPGA